jgi:hypothetical protein
MAFRFLNPEYREVYKQIDAGYKPLPLAGTFRSLLLILLAAGVTYVVGYALQDRAEMKGQAILAAHPSEELAPSQAEARYSTP